MKSLPYFILIAFIMLGAYTEFFWDSRINDRAIYMKEKAQLVSELEVVEANLTVIRDWYTYMPIPERQYQSPMNLDDFRKYTSPFGIRLDPTKNNIGGTDQTNHTGQDMTGETIAGTPDALVISIGVGIVKTKYYSRGYHKISGRMKWFNGHDVFDGYVVIVHTNGDESEYGHLDEIYVYEGDAVIVGTEIGRISRKLYGITTGPHLHFSLKDINGIYLPPFKYVNMPREVL